MLPQKTDIDPIHQRGGRQERGTISSLNPHDIGGKNRGRFHIRL